MNEVLENREILNLDYLKNLLIILNNCVTIDEINQIVGEKIKEVIPDAYIIISNSDEAREYSEVKKIFGFDKTLKLIKKYLKYEPVDYKYPIKKSSLKELEIYTSGKLVEFEKGLYELTNKNLPKLLSRTLEKMHDVKKTYGIGLSQNGIIYGVVALFTHEEIESSEKIIIESMVSQASLIIQKKFTEKNLKQSEDKYLQIAENIGVAIYLIEKDGTMIYTNSTGAEFVKKKKEEMITFNINKIFPAQVVEKLYPDIIRVIDTNKHYEGEREYIFKDKIRWFSTKIQPLYDAVTETTVAMVITADITEKKTHDTKLKTLEKEIKESEKLKTEFLANFSHEIRSLMNGITGFAQLIKGTDLKEEKDEYADIINSNSYTLMKLFNNIIDIAKIDAGIVNLQYGEFGLNRFLEDIYTIFKVNPKVQSNELELKLVTQPKDIILNTDELKFRQIFINLIDNAIKFSDKGFIEFGYKFVNNPQSAQKERVYFVKDTGIGISNENQEKIFRRFYQGEDINTRRYDGAGIGLSLVKGYVDVLKGNIWLESEKGKGTSFYFTIP